MYSKIQDLKKKGFSREAAAKQLNLSWATTDRYWDMTEQEYDFMQSKQFTSGLDRHEGIIVKWLMTYDDVSASQIQDWIMEHYQEKFNPRTVRNYVQKQRIKYNIPRKKSKREYGSIPELPPGQQMQVDFGEYWAMRPDKRRIKLYFVVFILSHSRYKYILWQTNPFTSIDFVRSLESCFEALGGIPKELVIDQDKLMVVNENYGDIIYTHEFERCKNRHGFDIWLCRKSDPESKGLVESGVKFVKYNFARHRIFNSLEQWSADSLDWLVRTGNGKVHDETKKIPAEVFIFEKEHLKPLTAFTSAYSCEEMISTPVRKNNTIRYKACRYTVPIGTYEHCKSVCVKENNGLLEIYDESGSFIDKHTLGISPGELIQNTNHRRDNKSKIQEILDETRELLGNTQEADTFLQKVYKTHKRYIRDQLQLIMSVTKKYKHEIIQYAVRSCIETDSYNATDFRDFANHWFRQTSLFDVEFQLPVQRLSCSPSHELNHINVTQHPPSVYQKIIRKEGQSNE